MIAILKNLIEIGLPFLMNCYHSMKKKKFYKKLDESIDNKHKLLSRVEKTMDKGEYSSGEIDGTYSDYLEIMIQAGYILLFGLSFPLCLILAVINNLVEHQVDRAKILYFTRRPTAQGAENIGIWRLIFYGMTIIGTFTYSGVLCITAETFSSDKRNSFIWFVWIAIVFLMLRWAIGFVINDTPSVYKVSPAVHL